MTNPGTNRQVPNPGERRGNLFDPTCPTRQLLDRIGTKWTSMVIKVLADAHSAGGEVGAGEVRFAELRRRTPGISQKMLSATLQSLSRDGLVSRRVEATVPPRVHYRLTPLGLSLDAALTTLRAWAEDHMAEVEEANNLAGSTEGVQVDA